LSQEDLFGGVKGTARYDPTEKYRYTLTREWDASLPRLLFVMLNPSTATAEVLDPTVRRCLNWALEWGYGSMEVCNLYAYRSPYPKDLAVVADPVGPDNDLEIVTACQRAKMVVLGWGVVARQFLRTEFLRREQEILIQFALHGIRTHVLQLTDDKKHPRHPLYLLDSVTPFPWPE
jgi:hypothetical protein